MCIKKKKENTECKLHYHIFFDKDTPTWEKEYHTHTHQIQQTYQEEQDIHAYVTHLYEKYYDNVPEASYSRYGNAFDDTLIDKTKTYLGLTKHHIFGEIFLKNHWVLVGV